MKKQFLNYGIDALLLVGFLVAFFLDLTGLDGHQLLGAAVFVFSAYHLILHWDWVKSVSKKLFEKVAPLAKAYYILDAILLVGLFLISETGIVISSWLNLELTNYTLWLDLHILVSVATLVALVLKIGLHWKWIVNTTRRIFSRQQPRLVLPGAPSLQPVPVNTGRREFVALMGVVGAASVIAAASGMQNLSSTAPETATTAATAATPQATSSTTSSKSGSVLQSAPSTSTQSSTGGTTTACRIRCNKGCSYPGRCRRYTDTNGNKKCDLGECL